MNKQKMCKQKFCGSVLAAALMTLATGAAHAAITSAYDFSYVSGGYTMVISNVTDTAATFDIGTLAYPNYNPITKGFDTDGVGGTLTLTENITNTGTTAWSSWSESLFNLGDGESVAGTPGLGVSWGALASSVAGTFTLNNATGVVDFTFDTALALGQTFTLTKVVNYDASVLSIGVEERPITAVPEASTYGMMLAGLGLVSLVVRRKNTV